LVNEKQEGMASAVSKSMTSPLELHMKKPSLQVGLGIALGAGIGAAIAVFLGSGGAWLAIGIAVGVVIGVAMSKRKAGPALSLPKGSSPLEAVRNDRRSIS
jgi:F0F1-type ATP synthase assembly protein I